VAVDEYEKENLSDFALWKAHGQDDAKIFWEHPDLGPGRPGWHIECTLINYFKFPSGTDIHTGGVDLMFPHHTNEIAQARPIYEPKEFVRYWLHSEHILVDNKKMAKSSGNFYTLADLEKEKLQTARPCVILFCSRIIEAKLMSPRKAWQLPKKVLPSCEEKYQIWSGKLTLKMERKITAMKLCVLNS
jgi:cysteinyl-tRNA synthetase